MRRILYVICIAISMSLFFVACSSSSKPSSPVAESMNPASTRNKPSSSSVIYENLETMLNELDYHKYVDKKVRFRAYFLGFFDHDKSTPDEYRNTHIRLVFAARNAVDIGSADFFLEKDRVTSLEGISEGSLVEVEALAKLKVDVDDSGKKRNSIQFEMDSVESLKNKESLTVEKALLAKVVNVGFAKDYSGKLVLVEAELLRHGSAQYTMGAYNTDKNVTFQVVTPGTPADGGLLAGQFCGINKEKSDTLFELIPGDKIWMLGTPFVVQESTVFHAVAIKKKSEQEVDISGLSMLKEVLCTN